MNSTKVLLILLWALLGATFIVKISEKFESDDKPIKVWLVNVPQTVDPYSYDSFVHHIAFKSVNAALVSTYSLGQIKGHIASSWSNEDDNRVWSFEIRKDFKFSNSDVITPKIVALNFTRILYLMNSNDSKTSPFDTLLGFNSIKSPTDIPAGITYTNTNIRFEFNAPANKLLEQISFGLYGIAHLNDFDPKTGEWNNPHKATASGAHIIKNWEDDKITLTNNLLYPSDLTHPKMLKKIELVWSEEEKFSSHIIHGTDRVDLSKENDKLSYIGPIQSNFTFYRCASWAEKGSPCFDLAARTALRDQFYKNLAKHGVAITRSTFPLGIDEIEEPEISEETLATDLLKGQKVRYRKIRTGKPTLKFEQALIDAIISLGGTPVPIATMGPGVYSKSKKSLTTGNEIDIVIIGSGILVESPVDDLKFMFLSKEGIKMPDSTGEIKNHLSSGHVDPNYVNQKIWDQSIILPLQHYSRGLWVNKEVVDFSQINSVLPPTDLGLVGSR
jgi:hypothetical protein